MTNLSSSLHFYNRVVSALCSLKQDGEITILAEEKKKQIYCKTMQEENKYQSKIRKQNCQQTFATY